MNKILLVLLVSTIYLSADIVGQWKTIDDSTKEAKSLVIISKSNGIYTGKIDKIFAGDTCKACEGKYKNKSLKGVTIIEGLKQDDAKKYSGGSITDPKNDKSYKLTIVDNGDTITLRGYIGWGIASVGRKQTWYRIK